MKKMLGVVLIMVGLLGAKGMRNPVNAENNIITSAKSSDTLMVVSNSAPPGNPVSVQVKLINNNAIAGVQTTILFDTLKLAYNGVSIDSSFSSFSLSANRSADSIFVVVISLSGDSILPDSLGHVLFTVNFTVDSNATLGDSTRINLINSVLSDPMANQLSVDEIDGWVYIRGMKGDLNQDGVVNVTDVVREINIILTRPPAPTNYELWAGDVNDDGQINVVDVVATINIILGRGKGENPSGHAYIWTEGNTISLRSDVNIGGIQFDLLGDVKRVSLSKEARDMELYTSNIEGGKRIIIVSTKGDYIRKGVTALINFKGNASMVNVVASDANGNPIRVNTTGNFGVQFVGANVIRNGKLILEVSTPSKEETVIDLFDITGRSVLRKSFTLNPGINLINMRVNNLSTGIYFLQLRSGEGKLVKRLMINR